jgi:hypothetical protein
VLDRIQQVREALERIGSRGLSHNLIIDLGREESSVDVRIVATVRREAERAFASDGERRDAL